MPAATVELDVSEPGKWLSHQFPVAPKSSTVAAGIVGRRARGVLPEMATTPGWKEEGKVRVRVRVKGEPYPPVHGPVQDTSSTRLDVSGRIHRPVHESIHEGSPSQPNLRPAAELCRTPDLASTGFSWPHSDARANGDYYLARSTPRESDSSKERAGRP